MTKTRLYLFDTTLCCRPCPQPFGGEDRQLSKTAIAQA